MPWTSYLLMAVAAAAAFFIGSYVASWLAGVVRIALERTGLDPAVRRLVVQAVRPVAIAVAVVAALSYIGADMSGLVAVLGASTLAVGLALKSSLSNVASGSILLTLRPYREGDFVQVSGQLGTVTEQGLLTTSLRTPQGVVVTLPNDVVFAGDIHNYTRNGQRRIDITVVVEYGADLDASMQAIREVLEADERVLSEPAPEVVVDGFGPRGVSLVARSWVQNAVFGATRSDLHRGVLAALTRSKVTVPAAPIAIVEG